MDCTSFYSTWWDGFARCAVAIEVRKAYIGDRYRDRSKQMTDKTFEPNHWYNMAMHLIQYREKYSRHSVRAAAVYILCAQDAPQADRDRAAMLT